MTPTTKLKSHSHAKSSCLHISLS